MYRTGLFRTPSAQDHLLTANLRRELKRKLEEMGSDRTFIAWKTQYYYDVDYPDQNSSGLLRRNWQRGSKLWKCTTLDFRASNPSRAYATWFSRRQWSFSSWHCGAGEGQTHRGVEQNRKSRDSPTHIHSVGFQQRYHDNVKRKVLIVLQILDMLVEKITLDLYFIPYTKVTQRKS